jgi:hypothetical protein
MREQDEKDGLVECLAGLAAVAVAQSRLEYAARLCGAVEAQVAQTGYVFSPAGRMEYERDLAAVRTPLGDEVFAALQTEGRALTMEQAIEYAAIKITDVSFGQAQRGGISTEQRDSESRRGQE